MASFIGERAGQGKGECAPGRRGGSVQQQQAEELRVIRRHLENQRQAAKLNLAIGIVLLIMGGLMLQGAINVPLASDGSLLSIALLTLGGMLVIPSLTQLRGP